MPSHKSPSLDALWDSIEPGRECFSFEHIAALPALAQRYLVHSIAPGTHLARAVRLKMQGQIKLNTWLPFTAEQIISAEHGFLWKATVQAGILPISGFDQLLNGQGGMEWKVFGLIPIVRAWSADTTRSAIGRFHGESIWLPSLLLTPTTLWHELSDDHLALCLNSFGESTTLTFQLSHQGQLSALQFLRWGELTKTSYDYRSFGGTLTNEKTFQGYTIPTEIKVGWNFTFDCSDSWNGEFFRASITEAQFR